MVRLLGCLACLLFGSVSFADPPRYADRRIDYRDTDGLIALTFDDGPSVKTTEAILAELDRQKVHATFFVTGHRLLGSSPTVERQRALLREEINRGHVVGNHTFSHARLSDLSPDGQAEEILRGEQAIEKVLSERPYLFRPPYGRLTPAARKLLRTRRYTIVQWNVSSDDPYLRTPEKLVAQAMKELTREGGGIVLFHDTHPWTASALPAFFAAVAEASRQRVTAGKTAYQFVELERFTKPRGKPRRTAPISP